MNSGHSFHIDSDFADCVFLAVGRDHPGHVAGRAINWQISSFHYGHGDDKYFRVGGMLKKFSFFLN